LPSLGSLVVNLQANTSNFTKGMSGAQKTLAKVGAAAVAVIATKKFIEFDDAMRSTQAVTQATGATFEALTARAKELGASTSFTAVEVANLMTVLGRAGFRPDSIIEMTDAVLDLARATGTEASTAAGIMGATIRQFNLGAEDATKVADILTHTANSTFNTVEQLGEAMKFAGPAAQDLGVSLEDTAAAVGMLGNIGIQGTMAGTAIRRLAVKTGAEAKKMEEAFGFAFTTASGEARPLLDNLEDLGNSLAKMSGPERMGALSEAFGLLGVTGASALGKSAAGAKALAEELRTLTGTAKKAADLMDAGLGGASRRATSALEGLKIEIGDQLAPAMTMLAEVSSVVFNAFNDFAHILVPVGTAVLFVTAAVLAYVAVTKIWIPAQVTVLALMGPKGWAILAGAGVAIGLATWALSENAQQAKDTAKAQEELKAAQNAATASADSFKLKQESAALQMENTKKAADELATALRDLESPQQALNREVDAFKTILMATNQGIVWDDHPLVKAMRQQKSGFTDTMRTITDDLRVLRGEATETAIELERMLEGIAPQDRPEIKAAFNERERLQAEKRAAEEWRQQADAVAKERNKPAKVAKAIKAQAAPAQQFASVLQRGSSEAFSLAVRSQRQGKSPEVSATNKVEKAVNRQSKIAQKFFDKLTTDKAKEQPAV